MEVLLLLDHLVVLVQIQYFQQSHQQVVVEQDKMERVVLVEVRVVEQVVEMVDLLPFKVVQVIHLL